MKRILLALAGLLSLACLSGDVPAAPSACPVHFAAGEAPETAARSHATTRELCFQAFAVLHDGTTRTPVYSAEHLTADAVRKAAKLDRVNRFHAEPTLPADERAELEDYLASKPHERAPFDRGHMAPNKDMPARASATDSFSLANMVPQYPLSNERLWKAIEDVTRKLAVKDGELYLVTGPIFDSEHPRLLHGRVAVPDRIFKAVYDPKRGAAAAYVVHNAPGNDFERVTLDELRDLTGLDAFPGIEPAFLALPTPAGGSAK